MGKLEFNQEVGLHNKFHVIVTDVRTGEEKQEAWAYNLILDQGLEKIIRGLSHYVNNNSDTILRRYKMMRPADNNVTGNNYRYGGYVHIGTGVGNLSVARTQLFGFYKGFYGEFYDRDWKTESMSGHYTLKAVIPPGEQYPGPITEIGLASYINASDLSTHALLQDSEGGQINLVPGPYEQITIYATSYISLRPYTNGKVAFVDGPLGNFFRSVFVNNAAPSADYYSSGTNRFQLLLGKSDKANVSSDNAVHSLITNKQLNYQSPNVTYDTILKRVVIEGIRFASDEGNAYCGVREIGLVWRTEYSDLTNEKLFPVFRAVLPIPGVWTGKDIEDEEVDTGDGQTKVFNLKWPDIVYESEEIYVQGRSPELQARGADYCFNNTSVPIDYNIGRYNYGVEGTGGTVNNIDNATDGDTGKSASILASKMTGNSYSSEPGLTFYYPTLNYTDKLRVYQGATGDFSIRAFRFQGSNDLENWTTIVNGELPNSKGWQEFSFTEVGYQYWRFFVDSSWGANQNVLISELEWRQTRPQIQFTVAPASGAAITANYRVEYIPKDENHVLDISFTFSFKDANAE